jgi:Domain of unknown function (DUF5914)
MHITEGAGMGSVVETNATPLHLDSDGRPRTMVTTATIAYSDRTGFQVALAVAAAAARNTIYGSELGR